MDIDNDFSNKMEALEIILHQNKKKISVYDYLRHRSIYEFFINWKEKGMTRKNAAFNAAKKVYDKGLYRARIINKWAKSWIENGVLPVSLQGCHQKIKSFIDDEDVIEKSLEFIRESEGKITPKLYRTFINNTLFSQMKITASISEKTSRVWLRKLGFVPQSRKKGIYFDGHERPDVLEYRTNFLKKMEEFEQLMPTFEGNNMEQKDPILPNGKKLHIFVTHDECLFYANDDRPIIWAPLGEPPLRKKGQGKSIMVSDFLLETIGCLKLTDEQAQVYPNISQEARKFLRPGKNEEGWWTAKHLLEQVKNNAIPIFEIMHPNAIAVFAFDNSTNHGAMADNALCAQRMNLNPGGQQLVMKDTVFGPDNKLQSMVFPSNHPKYPNQPKGIKQILIERGLWHNGLRLECELCKGKNKQIDPTRINCCARRIMSLQPDFLAQKSELETVIEEAEHKCIFYPKFHCELNFIEMYWGAAKRYTREHCDYTWNGLQKTVPEALNSIPLVEIRRFAQKSWRYMNIYRKGITGKLAVFAEKKYKSHRRVPDDVLNQITLNDNNE